MIELTEEEVDVLCRLMRALSGVVPELIIAGGQAARLLRLHPLAIRLEWNPLLTSDTDVATVDKGHRGNDLAKAFETEGFTHALEGDDVPPRTYYLRGAAEIELIVPDVARRHSKGATVNLLGVSAQKVKDLEPLLVEPTELEVPNVGRVRVPNPAAYIIQKVLTLKNRRSLEKKGKDALYAHDALLLFTHNRHLHPEVIALAARVVATLTSKQKVKLLETAENLSDARTDFVAESARQAEGRPGLHTAEAIALANRLGLKELLG
jgi:hypothetical protein